MTPTLTTLAPWLAPLGGWVTAVIAFTALAHLIDRCDRGAAGAIRSCDPFLTES
jgi:hypothetical protein